MKILNHNQDVLRLLALGGFGEVTQNMFVYHFLPQGKEENDSLLIVDCGVGFPEGDMPGVDLIIPDFSYVLKRERKIAGIVITHGHEDHIGALPIRVTHSIPDTFHFLIKTPIGSFYHGSDFKFDLTPFDGRFPDLGKIAEAGKEKVIALLSDCLGSEHPGYSPSEKELAEMFEEQIGKAKGRVLVTTISSNIHRWQQAVNASLKYGRKIVLVGMSVEKNIKLAMKHGYLNLRQEDLVKPERIKNYPDKKLTLLVGGSLGQAGSSLDKIVVGKHKIS